ncbi:MAG: CBS domain-containing protein [Alphaproteobacteria bacterium]|nr:CBS domain-containing protein [Alphaproteobacteria bacterium]NCQ87939.1 CBS domain-containing protein [Alphaproteobacteria bacterium]NCT05554.1 CBS domain-containing protein [Alphaproteobacteria bacterium]
MAPCSDAMIKDVITIRPDNTVEEAIVIFENAGIRSLPVVNDKGKLVGLFGLRHVLLNLLPKSVTMDDGVRRLDFILDAAPGIAKRLKKTLPLKVEEIMDKNPTALERDTSMWEAVRVMALHGSPLSIIDPKTGDFVGMISRQTLLKDLHRMVDEMSEEDL